MKYSVYKWGYQEAFIAVWMPVGGIPSNKVFILHNTALTARFICQSFWENTVTFLTLCEYRMRQKEGEGESQKHGKLKPKPTEILHPRVGNGVEWLQTVVCRLKRSRVTAERNAGMLFWWCRWRATISPRVLENSVSMSCMLPLAPCTRRHEHTRVSKDNSKQ